MAEGPSPSLQFPQTAVECEKCGADVDVTWFCKNCPASLCKSCKEDHSKDKLLKKHEVVQRSGSVLWSHGSWKLREQCKIHKNSYVETYCNDCKVPCCIDCMIENHRRHDLAKLNTKYFEAELRLNSFVDDLSKSSIQTIQNDILMLKEKIETTIENFDNVKSELNAAEIKLQNVVSQSFVNLRKDLDIKQNKITSEIEEKIKSRENQLSEIENDIAKTELKIRTGGLDLIEYFPSHPVITLFHSDIATPIPCFVFNENILKECCYNIGQIHFKANEGNGNQVSLQDRHDSVQDNEERINISDFDIEMISTFDASNFCGSLEPVSSKTAWVSWQFSNMMYLFDESGTTLRSIKVKNSKGIYNMAVQNNGDIIITCWDRHVRRVSVDGKITSLIDTTPFCPRGVCLTDREEIVVCMSDRGEKNHLAVYTPDGKSKVREIMAKNKDNQQLLTYPSRVVISNDQITVLNHRKNVVSLGYLRDDILWMYDSNNTKLENEFEPYGMCKDTHANIFVTDNKNHYIHFIDKKGSLLKLMICKEYGLEYPWGIGVDSQSGKIWCGSGGNHSVVILQCLK